MTDTAFDDYLAESLANSDIAAAFADDPDEIWRTIGAKPGADGKKHGGTPVKLNKSTGEIEKGPKKLVGKKADAIPRKATGVREHKPLPLRGAPTAAPHEMAPEDFREHHRQTTGQDLSEQEAYEKQHEIVNDALDRGESVPDHVRAAFGHPSEAEEKSSVDRQMLPSEEQIAEAMKGHVTNQQADRTADAIVKHLAPDKPFPEPWNMKSKDFYKKFTHQHALLRDNPEEAMKGIESEGFRRGQGPNAIGITQHEPMDIMQKRYGTKAGNVTYAIPKEAVKETGNGPQVKEGYKPTMHERAKIARDYEPMHEALVRSAVERGEKVLAEVLAEYPHLKKGGDPGAVEAQAKPAPPKTKLDLFGKPLPVQQHEGLWGEGTLKPVPKPVAPEAPKLDPVDAKIAKQYDPAATKPMFEPEKVAAPKMKQKGIDELLGESVREAEAENPGLTTTDKGSSIAATSSKGAEMDWKKEQTGEKHVYNAPDGVSVAAQMVPHPHEKNSPFVQVHISKGEKTSPPIPLYGERDFSDMPDRVISHLRKLGVSPSDGQVIRKAALPTIDKAFGELRKVKSDAAGKLNTNVPGLEELRKAADESASEQDRHHYQFRKMMEDEHNDGARPPKPINQDKVRVADELRAKYPRAALYLRAESARNSTNNYHKSSAATDAMEMLRNGGSTEEAAKRLENWLEGVDVD